MNPVPIKNNQELFQRIQVFLDLIAWSEGTDFKNKSVGYDLLMWGISSDGTTKYTGSYVSYGKPNTLEKWGRSYIQGDVNLKNHPNIFIKWKKGSNDDPNNFSTAAGRYQILANTWNTIATQYNLNDFTPSSQDNACIVLLERAIPYLKTGEWDKAIISLNKLFPSLAQSGYKDQTSFSLPQLTNKINEYLANNKPLSSEAKLFFTQYFPQYLLV
jgi:muramidase (phage lysozyme)